MCMSCSCSTCMFTPYAQQITTCCVLTLQGWENKMVYLRTHTYAHADTRTRPSQHLFVRKVATGLRSCHTEVIALHKSAKRISHMVHRHIITQAVLHRIPKQHRSALTRQWLHCKNKSCQDICLLSAQGYNVHVLRSNRNTMHVFY